MAFDVLVSIVFEVREEATLVDLARGHARRATTEAEEGDVRRDVVAFLTAVGEGTTIRTGTKGSVCAWGYVGNYSRAEGMAEALVPFFTDAWRTGALFDFSGVAIMWQSEHGPPAHVVQLRWSQSWRGASDGRVVVENRQPLPIDFGVA